MRDDLNGVLQTAVQSYFARGRRVARGWTPGPAPHSERIRAGLLGQDLALLERAAVGDAAVSESEVEAAAGRVLDDLYRPLALDAPVLPPGFDDMPLGQALVAARAHAAGTAAAVALPAPEPEAPISPDTPSPGVPTAPRAGAAEWLLGESAIRGVLYLGGLLVTVAAAIFVAYNWGSFPGVLKVASIMATTAGVGALGYVLAATPLRAAGVTFIAIGSLLAPLNFSALQSYVLGPAGTPPEIAWLTGAVVCGAFYVITAHWLRNPLFSYAAALAGAAGVGAILSAVKAPENLWAPVGIAVVGLLMTGAHEADRGGAPDYVTTPFRRFALAAIVVLLFPLWVLGLDAPSSFNPNRNSLLIGQALAAALLLFHGVTTGWRVTRGLAYVLAALDYLMLVWLLDLGRLGSGALLMAAAAALLAVSQSPTVRRLGAADERTLRGAAYVLALITTEMALGAAARLHVMLALLADVGLLAGSAYADRARRFGVAWRWAAALLFVIPWVQAATLLFPGESPAATVSLALLSGLYLAAAFVQRHRSAATALPLTAAALLLAPIAGLIAVGERNTALGAFVLFASACAYAGVAVASGRSWLLALALPQVNLALFLAPVAVDRRLPQDNPDLFLWSQVALSLAYLFGARLAEVRAGGRWAWPAYVWGALTVGVCYWGVAVNATVARTHVQLFHADILYLQVAAVAGGGLLLLAWLRRRPAGESGLSNVAPVYAGLAALAVAGGWLLLHVGLGVYAPAFMVLGLLAAALAGLALPRGAVVDLYGTPFVSFGLIALAAPLLIASAGRSLPAQALTFALGAALYAIAAWARQQRTFGYGAALLVAFAYLVALDWRGVTEVQAWAIPFGLGLLIGAAIERDGFRRWLLHPQEVALLLTGTGLGLLYGTALWQAHGPGAVPYFLLLVAETVAGLLWGLHIRSRSWVILSTGVLALEAVLRLWDGLTALPAWAALGAAGSVLLGVGVLLLARRQQMLALRRAAVREWEAWKL